MPIDHRWTTIPDCSEPDSVADWSHTDLTEVHRKHLLSLYAAANTPVDALGSTETVARMAAVFTSLTGIPTMPYTLFRELVKMRKAGLIPPRDRPQRPTFVKLQQPEPEEPA